jgi:hydroxymethylpyrimidine/phosphomethylpyrimidine kinase
MQNMARVLAIGGSDSGGGAGIQADIKTITTLGGYATTAITAVTAQNTEAVFGVQAIDVALVVQQINAVLDDIGADAIKTGMLWSCEIVAAVCDTLAGRLQCLPLMVDPVLVSSSGDSLLADTAMELLKTRLLPLASIVTPNVPEAERLSGLVVTDLASLRLAARKILTFGPKAVLLKGGHLAGSTVTDMLVTAQSEEQFSHARIPTRNSHGTGCTLAAALATRLAQGQSLRDAVIDARAYVLEALRTAPGFGRGNGPLNHGCLAQDSSRRVRSRTGV